MATIEQGLKPWLTPNFATLETKDCPGIRLADLTTSALNEMVADWLEDVYRKAGKQSPWKNVE